MAEKRDNISKRTSRKQHEGSGNGLKVGRIEITPPRLSELTVYDKATGGRGATVVCYADGGRYGVSGGVLRAFPEPGTYHGVAYVARERGVVFSFLEAGLDEDLAPRLGVNFDGLLLNLRPQTLRGGTPAQGSPVAFYARSRRFRDRTMLTVTDVFPLDVEHVAIIVKLIAQGALEFPRDEDVLEPLFDGLAGSGRGAELLTEEERARALTAVANNPAVAEEWRRLARVELSRPGRGLDGTAGVLARTKPKPPSPKLTAAGKAVPGTGDVDRVDLLLE